MELQAKSQFQEEQSITIQLRFGQMYLAGQQIT
jgi:hypothetical protein